MRLATPDLERILSVYCKHGPEQGEYVEWAIEFCNLPRHTRPECFIVNHSVRAWGHRFIYDQPTLRESLLRTGFVNVRRFPVGQSDDPNLTGLESHQISSGEFANSFETMVFQAQKP
ncbi:MAG: hypothetical protein M1404_00990 [Acidobacteria bacterium]|nr:hypothetical protein [Acidobacteriota bacterium]